MQCLDKQAECRSVLCVAFPDCPASAAMSQTTRKLPVDRGWAWVVLFGGAISGVLVSVGYVVGIFNVTFLEVFGKDKFTTSWIGSLSSSLIMITGKDAALIV